MIRASGLSAREARWLAIDAQLFGRPRPRARSGATVAQVASTLIKNGVPHLGKLRDGLEDWMDKRGFSELSDFRGTLSQRVVRDPGAFERAQYVHLILSQNS